MVDHLRNEPLAALPRETFQALAPDLGSFPLKLRTELYQQGDEFDWDYFPQSGMLSLLQVMQDSKGIEIATVGREGVVGAMSGFGLRTSLSRVVVQMPMIVSRISASRLRKAFKDHVSLQGMAIKHNEVLLAQTQITAACNALHAIEQRFCRWILQTSDRANSNKIQLTQEFLSEMLGVRRTSVTDIAKKLRTKGLINYSRGALDIVNRTLVEEMACECYRAVRDQHDQILTQTVF